MAQDVAILDFGSGKISVLIGERGVNNTICINGKGECDYAGFGDGEWYEQDQLGYVIGHAIHNAETNSRTKISMLYVGVPGEFTTAVCRDVSMSLTKKRKVTEADVDALHEMGDVFKNNPDYTVINSQPIYYTLDDGGRLIQPVGLTGNKLHGHISYILAENRFISLIDAIMSNLGIESVEYVSSVLAEGLLLFDDVTRDQYVVMIDVGHITTSVALLRGDGILSLSSFSMGGGYITADLTEAFGISFTQAESLKRKVVLSLNVSENDVYEITEREQSKTFPAKMVNEIVMERIKLIASTIEKCLNNSQYEFPDYIPYNLTGGGLCYLKGARDYLSKRLAKPVEIAAPSLPQFNRPHLSSELGLLNMVLGQQAPAKKKGFFARLFGK
ncbi:MAG: rod shape-determining protein [Clostridiales bacterium]|nr:rod shape-determining protein [Clostridiales bacterium]